MPLIDADLFLVASVPRATIDVLSGRHVCVDWGPAFLRFHNQHLPRLSNPGTTPTMGAVSAQYVLSRRSSAYLPARYVRKFIDSDALFLVADAPHVRYPIWTMWRDDPDRDIERVARKLLSRLAVVAEQTMIGLGDAH